MILKIMIKLSRKYLKRENRDNLYKKNNNVPNVTLSKHTFESILSDFSKLKPLDYNTRVTIYYSKYIPQDRDSAILNCANNYLPNAGYPIDESPIQEGQLFNDLDLYAHNECLYPFNLASELLYARNVTFHNNKGEQWHENSLRKNDMIIAAAKQLNNPKYTQKYTPTLKNTIKSIFKIAAINNNKKSVMGNWMWSFSNDPVIVSSLFLQTIKQKKISSFFTEIIMVIYDPIRYDKKFLDEFISGLILNNINYNTYYL